MYKKIVTFEAYVQNGNQHMKSSRKLFQKSIHNDLFPLMSSFPTRPLKSRNKQAMDMNLFNYLSHSQTLIGIHNFYRSEALTYTNCQQRNCSQSHKLNYFQLITCLIKAGPWLLIKPIRQLYLLFPINNHNPSITKSISPKQQIFNE